MAKQSPQIKDILNTQLNDPAQPKSMTVQGWIRTKRESKSFCFLEINDGSSINNLQVICPSTIPNYEVLLPRLTTGSSLKASGQLVLSLGKGQTIELQATEIELIGEAPAEEYPLQKKRHSFEFLREIAHLRPRTNTFGAITRVRSTMSFAIHRFFQEKGFLYVHTPIITTSDCEGAGKMFQVTTLFQELQSKKDLKEIDPSTFNQSNDFFGKNAYLTVSGQLEGEIYACAFGKVYTFGPTFRAEHSSTTRHLAEFWMIEPEMAFCDINGDMDLAEEFLKYIFQYLLDHCAEDMDFFNKFIDNTILDNIKHILSSQFERITYTEVVEHLNKAKIQFEYPVHWGVDLQSEHEKYLTEQVYQKPVIITDYPKEIKAFYMKPNDDDKTVRAMDVIVPRLGEIIGGSERESDYDKLLKRLEECGLKKEDYWWYLELRRYGTVPHAGFGLGFERLIQFVTGMKNIRDVIPFPRAYQEASF